MTRVAASRKRTHSIMSGAGFGDLIVCSGGKKLVVPQRYITKEGLIYKRVNRYIVEQNFNKLEELGVVAM